MLKNKKLISIYIIGIYSLILNITHAHAAESRPYWPAITFIGGIKSALAAATDEIDRLENQAVGVPSLKAELAQAKAQLASTKDNFGILALEQQQQQLKNKFDNFAQRFFKTAQIDNTFMYADLNAQIFNMINDPEIQRRLQKIVQLKREIAERLTSGVRDVINLGQQINTVTSSDQAGLAGIKTTLASIQQQITTISVSSKVREVINPLQQRINELQQKINDLLALRFTDDRLNLIARYKNRIRQYEILLDYLRDPSIIPLTTEDKILATE